MTTITQQNSKTLIRCSDKIRSAIVNFSRTVRETQMSISENNLLQSEIQNMIECLDRIENIID